MTLRLATHADVAARAYELFDRLVASGVDVEPIVDPHTGEAWAREPLRSLLEENADLALVGIRALSGTGSEGVTMLATLPREEPRDVVVVLRGAPAPLRSLRPGARVGVGTPRRKAFLLVHRPDVVPVSLDAKGVGRGADSEDFDAVILGSGEARRAGLADRIGEVLDARSWLPEPGQGVVAVVARHPIAEVTALDHLPTRTALRAELALLDALDFGVDVPFGSLAQPSGRLMRLWAAIVSADGKRLVRSDLTGPLDEPELLGTSVARQLVGRGADVVLEGATP